MKSVGSRQYYFSFSSLSWLTNMKLLYLDSASVQVAHHSLHENVYHRELQSDSYWSKQRSCKGCLNSVPIHMVCLLERAVFGSVVCGVFTELAPTYRLKAKYQSLSNQYLSILQGGYRLTYLKVASSPVASNNSLGKRNDLAYCSAEP